jgi:zinc transporter ZupT
LNADFFSLLQQQLLLTIKTTSQMGEDQMNVSRKLGILVFCGVPAIVGGGILYAIYGSYLPVFVFELLLIFAAGSYVSR